MTDDQLIQFLRVAEKVLQRADFVAVRRSSSGLFHAPTLDESLGPAVATIAGATAEALERIRALEGKPSVPPSPIEAWRGESYHPGSLF